MQSRVASLAAIAVLSLAIYIPEPAAAHAEFVSADPAPGAILSTPPTFVRVTVSEAVNADPISIFATNSTGARFDEGPTRWNATNPLAFSVELAQIASGIYTVAWRAVSADDGHLSVGSFYFVVTNPDGSLPGPLPETALAAQPGPVSPFEIAFRFLAFFGLASALGAAAFAALVWSPILSPAGRGLLPERAKAYESGLLALAGWGRFGALLFAAGIVGWWVTAATTAGFASAFSSPFALSLAARLILALVLTLVLSTVVSRYRSNVSFRASRSMIAAAAAVAVMAVAAGSVGTHGAAVPAWRPVGTLADALHVLGASLWVGGLLALVCVQPWLRSKGASPHARRIFLRFSRFAFVSVGLILFGGTLLSIILAGSWEALVSTGYGAVVLAKISLFVPMAALGVYNHYRLRAPSGDASPPDSSGLDRPSSARRAPDDSSIDFSTLLRNVRVEAILGACVLLLAGLLATLSPVTLPSQGGPPGGIFVREATNGSLVVELSVFPYPTVPSRYVFDIQVWYAANRTEYIRPQNGTVNLTLVAAAQAPVPVPFIWTGVNHFFVDTDAMDRPGTWRVDLPLITPDGSVAHFTFYLQLRR